jgi:hypothetical protein
MITNTNQTLSAWKTPNNHIFKTLYCNNRFKKRRPNFIETNLKIRINILAAARKDLKSRMISSLKAISNKSVVPKSWEPMGWSLIKDLWVIPILTKILFLIIFWLKLQKMTMFKPRLRHRWLLQSQQGRPEDQVRFLGNNWQAWQVKTGRTNSSATTSSTTCWKEHQEIFKLSCVSAMTHTFWRESLDAWSTWHTE